jgi:hypothetical protein
VYRDGPIKLYSEFKRRICELQESSIRLISATEGRICPHGGVSAARNLQLQEILAVPLISGNDRGRIRLKNLARFLFILSQVMPSSLL